MENNLELEWAAFAQRIADSGTRRTQVREALAAIETSDTVRELKQQLKTELEAFDMCTERLEFCETLLSYQRRGEKQGNIVALLLTNRRARKQRQVETLYGIPGTPPDMVEELRWQVKLLEASRNDLRDTRETYLEDSRKRAQRIDDLRGQIRAVKQGLLQELSAVRQTWKSLTEECTVWATEDRAHLLWFLEHRLAPHEPIIRRYVKRHGCADVQDLLVRYGLEALLPLAHRRDGRDGQWRFVFLENPAGKRVHSLPFDHDKAVVELARLLKKSRIPADAALVLQELVHVTTMPLHDRHRLKHITDALPLGWKIVPVGNAVRALLNIKEEERVIEFTVALRRDAYAHQVRGLKQRKR